MNTRGTQIVTLAGALIAGFAGGCLSRLVSIPPGLDHAPGQLPAVRAGAFEVVDEHGRVRARLGSDGLDPALDLFNEDGRIMTTLRMQGNGRGALAFSDGKWEARAVFGSLGGGSHVAEEPERDTWGMSVLDQKDHGTAVGVFANELGGSVLVRSPTCQKPFDCLP